MKRHEEAGREATVTPQIEAPPKPGKSACFAAWGKLKRGDRGEVAELHPLVDHMLDVAVCFLRIVDCDRVRKAMEATAGRSLDHRDLERLAALAFLHDFGKANCGFQRRYWTADDVPSGWPVPTGHGTEALMALAGDDDNLLAGLPFDEMPQWGGAFEGLLWASLSHHGRPLGVPLNRDPDIWKPVHATADGPGYSPAQTLQEIGKKMRQVFAQAFEPSDAPLPDAPAFVHLFAGLVQLADWLASDTRFFPYTGQAEDRTQKVAELARNAVDAIGLDVCTLRAHLRRDPPSFATALGVGDPRPIQRALGETGLGQLLILESETGSGKTEAALWRFARLFESGAVDALYFALPTRVAATQIYERVQDFVRRLWPIDPPVVVRALPGYASADGNEKIALSDFKVLWSDHPDDLSASKRWAAESPKRFLAATIAVGTVDQALMAALRVRHAHLRHALLSRALLVVDEVHASDAYMSAILESLLCAHLGTGGHALLLSATLGSRARTRFQEIAHAAREGGRLSPGVPVPPIEDACSLPYPALTDGLQMRSLEGSATQKVVHWQTLPTIDDPASIARLALDAAAKGARVLIIRNTVPAAVATLREVEAGIRTETEGAWLFKVGGASTLHHSRFSRQDRPLLDAMVATRLGKVRAGSGPCILIGTQTLEQSLDIDADLLISDICPMDVLLQRVGRLHRHVRLAGERPAGFEQARAWVLTPQGDSFDACLQRPQHGLGRHPDGGGVYQDLRIVEATRRLIAAKPYREIPRENRELVERATHPECLQSIEAELGEAWSRLVQALEGEIAANRTVAMMQTLPYHLPFEDIQFPDEENKVATRLGAADRLVELDPPLPGPFGVDVRQLTVRHHLIRHEPGPPASASHPIVRAGGFEFDLGNTHFRYSRFGLERMQDSHIAEGTS